MGSPTNLSNVLELLFHHSILDSEFLASMAAVSKAFLRTVEAAWELRHKNVEACLTVPGAVFYPEEATNEDELGDICDICHGGWGWPWPFEGASLVCDACTREGPMSVRLVHKHYCAQQLAMSQDEYLSLDAIATHFSGVGPSYRKVDACERALDVHGGHAKLFRIRSRQLFRQNTLRQAAQKRAEERRHVAEGVVAEFCLPSYAVRAYTWETRSQYDLEHVILLPFIGTGNVTVLRQRMARFTQFVRESPGNAVLDRHLERFRAIFVDKGRAKYLLPASRAKEYVERVLSIGGKVSYNNGAASYIKAYLEGNTDLDSLLELVELTDCRY
jgi:hypothetical protein